MDEAINALLEVKNAIQRLEYFMPTEHNCKQIFGSVQRLDLVVGYLKKIHIVEENDNGEQND